MRRADRHRRRAFGRAAWLLVGVAGVLTPAVTLALAADGSYSDVRYSAYVLALMITVHAAVWLVVAALTWRWLGGRFVEAFPVGSWLALGAAVAAVDAIDHPYVYLTAYVVVAAVTTVVGAMAARSRHG